MITQQDLQSLVTAAANAGYVVNVAHLTLLSWNMGVANHIPLPLPNGFNAVYIFEYGNTYLKVGKACGPNANPRYQSQHYYTKAPSTLAKSLLGDTNYILLLQQLEPRNWIIHNTNRYNILIPIQYNTHFVSFAESFFILKCNPVFEG
jgi:hypothetical protein